MKFAKLSGVNKHMHLNVSIIPTFICEHFRTQEGAILYKQE